MRSITDAVKQLIIINVIVFVGSQLVPISGNLLAMYYPENTNFRVWQPLSHMFMHGGIAHLFFNMFALYSFGTALEQFWGARKFLFFYISCGLGAVILHTLVNYYNYQQGLEVLVANGIDSSQVQKLLSSGMIDNRWQTFLNPSVFQNFAQAFVVPVVGASGAIYGLLTAFAFMFPEAELGFMFIPVPIKAKYFVPGIIVIDLILGFKGGSIFGSGGTGIAHFAHIGGALIGFLMMWYWKRNQFNNRRWN